MTLQTNYLHIYKAEQSQTDYLCIYFMYYYNFYQEHRQNKQW